MLRDDAEPCCRLHSLGARAGVGYGLTQYSIRWHAINSGLWWGRLQLSGADLRIRARACRKCLAYSVFVVSASYRLGGQESGIDAEADDASSGHQRARIARVYVYSRLVKDVH